MRIGRGSMLSSEETWPSHGTRVLAQSSAVRRRGD
jgi:hypothetical protein